MEAHLSNAVILSEVDSQGDEVGGGGQVLAAHEQVQHDGHGVGVDEHGLVSVLLGDVVQQAQRHPLEPAIPHQLHSLHQITPGSVYQTATLLEDTEAIPLMRKLACSFL